MKPQNVELYLEDLEYPMLAVKTKSGSCAALNMRAVIENQSPLVREVFLEWLREQAETPPVSTT